MKTKTECHEIESNPSKDNNKDNNEANFDVLYTIYCNLGQFILIIHEADY
jgi:hypothetical protein